MKTVLLVVALAALGCAAVPPEPALPNPTTVPADKGAEVLARYRGAYANGELIVTLDAPDDGQAAQAIVADDTQTSEVRTETGSATPTGNTVLLRRTAAPSYDTACNAPPFGDPGVPSGFRGVCFQMTLASGWQYLDTLRPYVELTALTYTGGVPFGTVTPYNRAPTDSELNVSNAIGLWSYPTVRSSLSGDAPQGVNWYFATPENGASSSFTWTAAVKGRRIGSTFRSYGSLAPASLCNPDTSQAPVVSRDGNVIAWVTNDPSCGGAGPTNRQVVVWWRQYSVMYYLSHNYMTNAASNGDNINLSMDDSGQWITWDSTATDLFRSDLGDYKGNLEVNGANSDVIVADTSGAYRWFAVYNSNTRANLPDVNCYHGHISADASVVALESDGALTVDDFNSVLDVYMMRFLGAPTGSNLTGGTENYYWLATPDDGTRTSDAYLLGVSGSAYAPGARRVAFLSGDASFTHDFTTFHTNVFTNDYDSTTARAMVSGTLRRMTLTSAGTAPNDDAVDGAIDPKGAFVAFSTMATNMVGPTTTTGRRHVYYRGVTDAASSIVRVDGMYLTSGTEADRDSWGPQLDENGRLVAFVSQAGNLVTYPSGYTRNGLSQIFAQDMRGNTPLRQRPALLSRSYAAPEAADAVEPFYMRRNGDQVAFPAGSSSTLLDPTPGGASVPYTYNAPTY